MSYRSLLQAATRSCCVEMGGNHFQIHSIYSIRSQLRETNIFNTFCQTETYYLFGAMVRDTYRERLRPSAHGTNTCTSGFIYFSIRVIYISYFIKYEFQKRHSSIPVYHPLPVISNQLFAYLNGVHCLLQFSSITKPK